MSLRYFAIRTVAQRNRSWSRAGMSCRRFRTARSLSHQNQLEFVLTGGPSIGIPQYTATPPAFTAEAGVVLREAMLDVAQGPPLRQTAPTCRRSMVKGLSWACRHGSRRQRPCRSQYSSRVARPRCGATAVDAASGPPRDHSLGATVIGQIYELVTQLRGEAGARQVAGARHAIQENGGGLQGIEEAAVAVHNLSRW